MIDDTVIKRRLYIEFRKNDMNISKLADKLGIDRRTLINKINKLGLTRLYERRKKLNQRITFVDNKTNEKRVFENIDKAAGELYYTRESIRYALYTGGNIDGCKVMKGVV